MPLRDEARCKCAEPDPQGPYYYGAFQPCGKCKKFIDQAPLLQKEEGVKRNG